jgi:hypothetical protein
VSDARSIHRAMVHVQAALKHAEAALASYDQDQKRARPDLSAAARALVEAELIIRDLYNQFTPVDPPAEADMQKSRESSNNFAAVGKIFNEAQLRMKIPQPKRKSLPPKKPVR